VLFWVHMTQHEILMLVAAPLMVLGQPMAPYLAALPRSWARGLARAANAAAWRRTWSVATNPVVAWLFHGVVLWAWHVPALFQATLTSDVVHAAQHLSFLGSALLFWWAVVHGQNRQVGYGMGMIYLLSTGMHSGLLGALLTFARTVWYPAYATGGTLRWGLTALEDQQLGGLIMWAPAGLVYIGAGLALFAAWLKESERRADRRPRWAAAAVGDVAQRNTGFQPVPATADVENFQPDTSRLPASHARAGSPCYVGAASPADDSVQGAPRCDA
ncbi:MAG TPA: cytochrome c oxidase assembly protein, partial [Humisphaera sp.]